MAVEKSYFGKLNDGRNVHLYKLTNKNGMSAGIINYGGAIVSLLVHDRTCCLDDIVLGCDTLEDYYTSPYFGAIIGRYANRIKNGVLEINNEGYQLAQNDGKNHLHGGNKGFDKVLWDAEIIEDKESEALELSYFSANGEESYPGNLDVKVTYRLTYDNALEIDFYAVSDADTVVNLTNHSYFNLSGHAAGDIRQQELIINATYFTPVDSNLIPTGEVRKVDGTPMDFRKLTAIRAGIDSNDEQIKYGNGFDHNWVLDVSGNIPEKAAVLLDRKSGRKMELYTTKPGMQLYTGNFLDGTVKGKGGVSYGKWSGLCLETQHFPDAIAHKHFPSPILKAGEEYRHTSIFKFTTCE